MSPMCALKPWGIFAMLQDLRAQIHTLSYTHRPAHRRLRGETGPGLSKLC